MLVLEKSHAGLPIAITPIEKVQKAMTEIWEHPLLTPSTRDFRAKAPVRLKEVMDFFGISPAQYFATIVGSGLWIVKPQDQFGSTRSDLDIIVFSNMNLNELDERRQALFRRWNENTPWDDIQLVRFITHSEALNFMHGSANVLFTPDDYILGNVQNARTLRLELIDEVEKDQSLSADNGSSFWGRIDQEFKLYMLGWPERADSGEMMVLKKDRMSRFETNLMVRALQSRNPKKYLVAFKKARKGFELPPFGVYKEAIRESGGALNLDSRFAATGIFTSNVTA